MVLVAILAIVAGCAPSPKGTSKAVPIYSQEQYVKGMVALHNREYAAALNAAREALREAPDYADGHVLMAEVMLKQGREDEGLAELRKAEGMAPNAPVPVMLQGMVYELRGDLPKAQEFYRRARDSYDTERLDLATGMEYATVSYLGLGRLAGFQAIDPVLEKHPDDQDVRVMRSQIQQDDRQFFLLRVKPEPGAK